MRHAARIVRVEEPLALSAPLARELAQRLCRTDPASGECCVWYHGFWQYLRLLGLAMTAALHTDFYRPALQSATRRGPVRRVLISAAADYCTLAHAAAYLRERGTEPEFVVVDYCETALALNRWYADRYSLRLATWCGDILDFADADGFDVICTHSFFGRFLSAQRRPLVQKWQALLRPGGLVITANRIQPSAAADRPTLFNREQAAAFRATVLQAAEAMGGLPGIDTEALGAAADLYTSRPAGYPVRSREEFVALFGLPGLEPLEISWAPVNRGARDDVGGPRVPSGAEYGRAIIARRPAR